MLPTEIRLLGGFQMTREGRPVAELSGRLQALLAFVLLQSGATCSRRQIAFAFWPESTDSQARTNLRRLLLLLRRALPQVDDLLEITQNSVAWRPRIPVSVDLLAFAQGTATAHGHERRVKLTEALDVYAGDLLPDCYDEWLIPERERLRSAFIQGLDEMVQVAEGERDYSTAITCARRLLRHDPLHEAVYHQLMRLLALTGDRAGALHTYHACATLLHRELGVAPGPDIQYLYARLLEQEGAASPVTASRPAGTAERMVGRTDEWRTLQELWWQRQPTPHWALITGEAGMGKSRLAEEMLAWAERQAIPAAHARSYASTKNVSYGPVVDLLRADISTLPGRTRSA
jgi:DNA-binding SARP family transcriptional activator